MMLSALDLARRIEAGELTPRLIVELCAETIAAREEEVRAFVTTAYIQRGKSAAA